MTRFYETLYLVNPDLADDVYKDVVSKFTNLVEKSKGQVIRVDEWGKKTLAYQVKKFGHGYYVLLQYCGEPGITDELARDLRLDDRVLKFQTIKLSDTADPETLKRQAEEDKPKPEEEEAETPRETGEEKEGENGT